MFDVETFSPHFDLIHESEINFIMLSNFNKISFNHLLLCDNDILKSCTIMVDDTPINYSHGNYPNTKILCVDGIPYNNYIYKKKYLQPVSIRLIINPGDLKLFKEKPIRLNISYPQN
jgi:hypothetical protein